MVYSYVLLKPNVANILLFNFCEHKFVQHRAITIAIDCNGLPCSFLKKNCPIMPLDQNPHEAVPHFGFGFSMYACRFSVRKYDNFPCLRTRQDQNEFHLKRYFFDDNLQSNVAIYPSVVRACTQPYLFGERIKLNICQIRHELSVTIHEISIHTYVIGHYNPSVRIIDLVPHTIHCQ